MRSHPKKSVDVTVSDVCECDEAMGFERKGQECVCEGNLVPLDDGEWGPGC